MSGRLSRIVAITRTLMRQNRILLSLLLLWPLAMLGVLLAVEHAALAADDLAALLSQELYAGLVMVGLGASVALGTEEKARRVTQVLGRAVGRGEYLASLWASAFLPFVGYVAMWLVAWVLGASLARPVLPLIALAAELAAGFLLSALALLLAVLLPQVAASIGTGVALALGLYAGTVRRSGIGGVFAALTGKPVIGVSAGIGQAVAAGLVLAAFAGWLFWRQDLRLS